MRVEAGVARPLELGVTMSSSIPARWRDRMPPFLVEPAVSHAEDPGDARFRLGQATALFDATGRYLFALFAAVVGPEGHSARTNALIDRIRRPTLGLWWGAVDELAAVVSSRGEAGPLDQVAHRILSSEYRKAITLLMDERNQVSHHPSGSAVGTERDARAALARLADPVRRIIELTLPLVDAPLFVLTNQALREQQWHVGLISCVGQRIFPLTKRLPRTPGLESERPFVVETSGRVIYLGPMVRVTDDGRAIHLLYSGGKKTKWTSCGPGTPPAEAVLHPCSGMSVAKIVDEDARVLCGTRGTPTPVVDGYQIYSLLGRGGSSSVWKATDSSGDLCALKVLDNRLMSGPTKQRAEREIRLGCGLRPHPNVVRVLGGAETTAGETVIVQELAEGTTLAQRIKDQDLGPRDALVFSRQLARALQHLHDHQILHRDVKPENVILVGGHVKLVDLGLAYAQGHTRVTQSAVGLGTRSWSAPEQLRGEAVTAAADVYAAGRVIQAMFKASGDEFNGIRAVVRRATDERPEGRYKDGKALLRALEQKDLRKQECPIGVGDTLGGSWFVVGAGVPLPRVGAGAWGFKVQGEIGIRYALVMVANRVPDPLRNYLASVERVPLRTREGWWYCDLSAKQIRPLVGPIKTPAPDAGAGSTNTGRPGTPAAGNGFSNGEVAALGTAGAVGAGVIGAAVVGAAMAGVGLVAASRQSQTGDGRVPAAAPTSRSSGTGNRAGQVAKGARVAGRVVSGAAKPRLGLGGLLLKAAVNHAAKQKARRDDSDQD